MNIRYRSSHYFTLSHPLLGSGLRNYLRLLFRNGFRIDPRFSLKLLFSFATVIVWTPLRLMEKWVLRKKIKQTKVEAPIIILGHPRSGTTYLHYLLAADPRLGFSNTYEVFMPHIFFLFGKYIGAMMNPLMPKKRAMDNLSMGAYKPTMDEFALANINDASWCNGFYFPKNIGRYFDNYVTFKDEDLKKRRAYQKAHLWFARKMQLKNPGKTMIIKSAGTTARIRELLEIFPDARFVHIYRHPTAVYLSTERLYEKILPLFGFHQVSNTHIEKFIISSYKHYHQKWFTEKELIPKDNLVEFAFEDFVKNPIRHLEYTYATLGIKLTPQAREAISKVAENHASYQKNEYSKVNDALRHKLAENWGFCYRQWKYKI